MSAYAEIINHFERSKQKSLFNRTSFGAVNRDDYYKKSIYEAVKKFRWADTERQTPIWIVFDSVVVSGRTIKAELSFKLRRIASWLTPTISDNREIILGYEEMVGKVSDVEYSLLVQHMMNGYAQTEQNNKNSRHRCKRLDSEIF